MPGAQEIRPVPVPFDPELEPALKTLESSGNQPLNEHTLTILRAPQQPSFPDGASIAAQYSLSANELRIPGPTGAPQVEVTVFRPHPLPSQPLPILVNFHGGGMVVGHRSWEHARLADLVARHNVIGVNVEYRLAPEHPFPAGVEDNFAATRWISTHAHKIGGDPERLIVMGGSAGGGFAAAVCLIARDRGGPAIAGQLLLCPMLDNTNSTVSSLQYDGIGTWQRDANIFAWRSVLGAELAHSDRAPAYASPSRAADLSNLPPAFVEVGAAEVFRDEDTEYAKRIWAAGGQAELHVWAGGCHGFDMYAPEAEITRAALASRDSWLHRTIGRSSD